MADIEFSDGGSFEFDKLPGETLAEFAARMAAQNDKDFNEFKQWATSLGLGAMFGPVAYDDEEYT